MEAEEQLQINAKELCTCKNIKCKLHPANHDMGCTPCIEKNLRMDEMPNCFFDKIDPEHKRKGTSTKDYAQCLLKLQFDYHQEQQTLILLSEY